MRTCTLKIVATVLVAGALESEAMPPTTNPPLNQAGATFVAYSGSDVKYVDFVGPAVRNLAPNATWLVTSVAHRPQTYAYYLHAYVDGIHSGSQTTTLVLWSQDFTGTYLGSMATTASGSGAWRSDLYLSSTQASRWAYVSVIALVPANGAGWITGVTVPY